MENKSDVGVIVQARMGSSRLPGKMGKSFFDCYSLLEIVITKLQESLDNIPIIIATTKHERDNYIEAVAKIKGVNIFRGSEQDVLKRFVKAAEEYGLEWIVRVCADNPFIQPKFIKQLVNYETNDQPDYIGFRLKGNLPAIKSHLGFFPELISFKALKELHSLNLPRVFKEHVTNYFYSDDNDDYSIEWIDIDYPVADLDKIRLTVDTADDFKIAREIYSNLERSNSSTDDMKIFEYLNSNPALIEKMSTNIDKNEK